MTTYTNAQYHALHALAAAYGHGWATESDMPSAYPIPGAPWTRSFIQECYTSIGKRDRWEPWQYGISAPEAPGYSGAVCHTTSTGRLQWQVDPDGSVGLVICRPGREYLEPGETEAAAAAHREVALSRRSEVVLSARIDGGGSIRVIRTPDTRDHRIPDVYSASWSPEDGPRAEARHGDAMLAALSVLCSRHAALAALVSADVALSPVPPTDPLQDYSADEIIVGPGGETLAQAAAEAPEMAPGWDDRAVWP